MSQLTEAEQKIVEANKEAVIESIQASDEVKDEEDTIARSKKCLTRRYYLHPKKHL